MPVVEVPCPACGAKLKAPDDAVGRKAKCKKCGTTFRLPGRKGEPGSLASLLTPAPGKPAAPVAAAPADDVAMALPVDDIAPPPAAEPTGKPAKPARAKTGEAKTPAPPAKPATPSPHAKPASPAPTATPPAPPAPEVFSLDDEPEPLPLDEVPAGIPASATPGTPSARTDAPPRKRDGAESERRAEKAKKTRRAEPEGETKSPESRADDRGSKDDRPAKAKSKSKAVAPAPAREAESDNPFANLGAAPEEPAKAEKKSSRRDEEEDDRPAQKKRRDDDEDEEKPRKKRRRDEEDEQEEQDEEEKPRYRRPEKGTGKALIITAAVGLLAIGLAAAAVVVSLKGDKPPEETAEEKKKEEPPAAPGAPATPGAPGEPQPPTPVPEPKGNGPEPPPKGKQPGDGRPSVTFGKLRTFTVGAPAAKPQPADKPRTTLTLDSPLESVKRVFPPSDPKTGDTYVLVQTNPGDGGKGERLALDTYGPGGNRIPGARIEYDGDGLATPIADVSASKAGAFFLAATGGRLHVWNVIDNKKIADGIAPYGDKPEHAKSGLAAAFFTADPNVVALVSTAGGVLLYDLRTNKPGGEFIPPGGTPGSVSLGRSIAKAEGGGSVAVAVAGTLYQVATHPTPRLQRKHDLGGAPARSLGLALSDTPGRLLYVFETGADGKKDQIVLGWPKEGDAKPVLFRLPAGLGEPEGALWAGGVMGGVATERGVVWFLDDDEAQFSPLGLTRAEPGGEFFGGESSFWYAVADPKEAKKSVLVAVAAPFTDFGTYRKDFPNRPIRTLLIGAGGLTK